MRKTILILLLAGLPLCGTGCGTMLSFVGHCGPNIRPYGGVHVHLEAVDSCTDEPTVTRSVFLGSAILVDFPLSLTTDTLLLPFTLAAATESW